MSGFEEAHSTKLKPPQAPRKFYFLEYFYIMLESVRSASSQDKVFDRFVSLKDEHQLGESRYKKLTVDDKSSGRLQRYKYTFQQVLAESETYQLLTSKEKNNRPHKLWSRGSGHIRKSRCNCF